MKRIPICVAAVCVAVLLLANGGCEKRTYQVDLRPDRGEMQRILLISNSGPSASQPDEQSDTAVSPLEREERARLEAVYADGESVMTDRGHRFSGTFTGAMPQDVGGRGHYHYLESPLGSLSIYSERFRGSDDLTASWETMRSVGDEWVDLLLGWVDHEFADDDVHASLRNFVDGEFRRDFTNVLFLSWTIAADPARDEDASTMALVFRFAQFMVDHDYVTTDDLPDVLRLAQIESPGIVTRLIHQAILRKLQLAPESETAQRLAIVNDLDKMRMSLEAYFATTNQYAEMLQKWDADGDDRGPRPTPLDVPNEMFWRLLFPEGSATVNARLRVDLHCGVEPTGTNGTWDAESKTVAWRSGLDSSPLPVVVFAFWVNPDEDEQTRRLGSPVLSGENLAQFAAWHGGLSPAERETWATFWGSLTPDGPNRSRIKAFEFPDSPDLAEPANSLLINAIDRASVRD